MATTVPAPPARRRPASLSGDPGRPPSPPSERPRSSLQLIFANFAMDSIQDGGAPAFLAPGEVGSKSGGKLGGPAQLLGQGVV